MSAPQIEINASTSVVLVDSSQLTAGGVAVVLLSSIQTPGRVITVRDSAGYLSTPQKILVSTTSGVTYADGTSSIAITQPFGFISFESRDATSWNTINTFGFPLYQTIANVRTLQTSTITTQNIFASNTLSTNYLNSRSAYVNSTMQVFGPAFVSSLVVGMYPTDPLAYQYAPYSFFVNGTSQLNSNVNINGNLNVTQTISTGNALLVGGSLSTLGNAGIGGSLTATGNLIIGGNITAGSLAIQGATTMSGNIAVGSQVTVQNSLIVGSTISTNYITASTLNIISSLTFGYTKSIVSSAGGLTFSAPIIIPSLSTNSVVARDTITTSTLSVTGNINAATAPTFILGATDIQNPLGSLLINSISTNILIASTLKSDTINTSSMNASTITVTGNIIGSPTSIGSFYRLTTNTISANTVTASTVVSDNLISVSTFSVSSAVIQQSMTVDGGIMYAENLQLQGANLNVSTVTANELYTSSLTLINGIIEQPDTLTIKPGVYTPEAYASTVITSSLYVTSALNATKIMVGSLTTIGSNGPYLSASNLQNAAVTGTGDYLNPMEITNTGNGAVGGSFYIKWNAGSPIPNSYVYLQISMTGSGQVYSYVSLSGQDGQTLTAYGPGDSYVTSNFRVDSSVTASTYFMTLTGSNTGTSAFRITANYASNINYTSVDSNSVLSFYNGGLLWNYALNDTVIRNPYNDMSIRNVYYYGGLNFSSDPSLKEDVEVANISTCYDTIRSLPLRRFKYTDKYISTFSVRDIHRLGVLANEVEEYFPKSITRTEIPGFESTVRTVDIQQIQMAHLGATKYLMRQVESLTELIRDKIDSNA